MCEWVGVCVGCGEGGRRLALSPALQCPGVVGRRHVGMAGVNDDLGRRCLLRRDGMGRCFLLSYTGCLSSRITAQAPVYGLA